MKLAVASVAFLAGLGAIAAGAWLIAPAAGLIVAGTLTALVVVAWVAGAGEPE